jgi:integrase
MAEDDIYGNKRHYEFFVDEKLKNKKILEKPKNHREGIYYCKNKVNLKYFNKLIRKFEVDDLSYARRLKLIQVLKILTYVMGIDLKDVNGLERDKLIIKIREITNSNQQLKRTQQDIKYMGKILFEDKEIPKFFKELEIKTDRSRQKARKDKLEYEEFEKLMRYFSKDDTLKAYLSVAMETLARPQELLYTKMEDVDFGEGYSFIQISEHGKEGIKKLLCIDSNPYLIRMISKHKNNQNKKEFLFLNEKDRQLTPFSINKKLKKACNKVKIDKPITCYSIKRFGVTFKRLMGEDDVTIQRTAGWTSTKQLKTYDLTSQDDVYKKKLAERGLIKDKKYLRFMPKTKPCVYCGEIVGFAESICPKCNHILDKDLIKQNYDDKSKAIEVLKVIMDDELVEMIQKKKQEHKEKLISQP